jgi:hypothetical protein
VWLSFTDINLESGLLIFKLIHGDLARANCHLEVLMDDYVFPAYSSAKVKSRTYDFNESELSPMTCSRLNLLT